MPRTHSLMGMSQRGPSMPAWGEFLGVVLSTVCAGGQHTQARARLRAEKGSKSRQSHLTCAGRAVDPSLLAVWRGRQGGDAGRRRAAHHGLLVELSHGARVVSNGGKGVVRGVDAEQAAAAALRLRGALSLSKPLRG